MFSPRFQLTSTMIVIIDFKPFPFTCEIFNDWNGICLIFDCHTRTLWDFFCGDDRMKTGENTRRLFADYWWQMTMGPLFGVRGNTPQRGNNIKKFICKILDFFARFLGDEFHSTTWIEYSPEFYFNSVQDSCREYQYEILFFHLEQYGITFLTFWWISRKVSWLPSTG